MECPNSTEQGDDGLSGCVWLNYIDSPNLVRFGNFGIQILVGG